MLFTERCRGLSVRHTDGSITRLFGSPGSSLETAHLFCQGQSGLHGIALDPAFATNRAVVVGPENALYIAIDGGEIWRVAPGV